MMIVNPADAPASGTVTAVPRDKIGGPVPLEPGAIATRVLRDVWSGTNIVTVDMRPGAPRDRLVAVLTSHLAIRIPITIRVVTADRKEARRIAEHLDDLIDRQYIRCLIPCGIEHEGLSSIPVEGVTIVVDDIEGASANPPECDLVIFTDADQMTFADACYAGLNANQLVVIGQSDKVDPTWPELDDLHRGHKPAWVEFADWQTCPVLHYVHTSMGGNDA